MIRIYDDTMSDKWHVKDGSSWFLVHSSGHWTYGPMDLSAKFAPAFQRLGWRKIGKLWRSQDNDSVPGDHGIGRSVDGLHCLHQRLMWTKCVCHGYFIGENDDLRVSICFNGVRFHFVRQSMWIWFHDWTSTCQDVRILTYPPRDFPPKKWDASADCTVG
jgi:hypothetical protein